MAFSRIRGWLLQMQRRWIVLLLACGGFGLLAVAAEQASAVTVDYSADIRPILSDACFHCHGPDEEHREAGLRLDQATSATQADAGGHAAIVPGELAQSELWSRIASPDPELVMPPPSSGKKLTEQQVALLRQWIEGGAPYESHWAFEAPQQVVPPRTQDTVWPRNPIDQFVLARLEQLQLRPNRPADRATLLRRLSLDLVGLPPALDELDQFLNDPSPEAYERQISRLLSSPHFGERWGRVWMDAARYADSDGFEKDKPRFVWFYRDWVVNALNANMPYDEFIIKQIAGDCLPNATQDDRVATGFLRNSMINEEGGVDPEQFRMEAMFDRMDAIGKSIMGLTVQCAQCHSHKYDPLSHEDYYRMFAFLNSCYEANMTVYTAEQHQKLRDVMASLQQERHRFKQEVPDWQTKLAEWERSVTTRGPDQWQSVPLSFIAETQGGQKFLPLPDGSYLSQGYAPTKSTPTAEIDMGPLERITAVRLEVMNDPSLPHGGPGRSVDGTWALSELEISVLRGETWEKVTLASAAATIAPEKRLLSGRYIDKSGKERWLGDVSLAIDGDSLTAWHGDIGPGRRNDPHVAYFKLQSPVQADGTQPLRLKIGLAQNHGGWNSDDNQTHNLGRFRVSFTDQDQPVSDLLPPAILEVLGVAPEYRSSEQSDRLFDYWLGTQKSWLDHCQRLEEIWKQHPEGTSQLVLAEMETPRSTYLLERGNFLNPQGKVLHGTPGFLHPLETTEDEPGPPRLLFAKWLASSQSPTTARSIVNRVWQEYFGTGLTATSDDLGLQGEPPSHPELLDWLAVDLMQNGWDLKRLHRQIVSSATYQQSSDGTSEQFANDPANRQLARGPRYRMPAEVIRDIALSASDSLDRAIGGPPVYPFAPEFLFQPPASYGPKTWQQDDQSGQNRRALYTFRFRSVPYPVYQAFDAPTGEVSCVRRSLSNTPLQALTTLNEPLFFECAKSLARVVLEQKTDRERLETLFLRCVARQPTAEEQRIMQRVLQQQRQRFESEPDVASKLLGSFPKVDQVTFAEQAAWTLVCRVALNLDESITKE